MSSHREAPETSKDPVVDSTDVYAFMNPQRTNRVVLIANFIPFQKPDGGPNFYEFDDDVLYEIHVSNTNACVPNVTFQFRFTTTIRNPRSFLYNTGPIDALDSPSWNRPQTYSVTKVVNGRSTVLGRGLASPPVNVGVRSTPDYAALGSAAVHALGPRRLVFAGQRADPFHVDLGSVFDLGGLRPFNEAHAFPLAEMDGINALQSYSVHTLAIQVPAGELTRDGQAPSASPKDRRNVIGVWATASRRKGRVFDATKGKYVGSGPWVQVSRLANPLFNELLVPMARKDAWNASPPSEDADYASVVSQPELQGLLPALYPDVFPNLAAYDKPRADLDAILLTGIPNGIIDGFQNYTGPRKADMLRLNMAVPPTPVADQSPLGILGEDLAGFPNGRRPVDDVVAIELKAVAGATIPLVDPGYVPDDTAAQLNDGTTNTNAEFLTKFPFLGLPGGGYQTVPGTTEAGAQAG